MSKTVCTFKVRPMPGKHYITLDQQISDTDWSAVQNYLILAVRKYCTQRFRNDARETLDVLVSDPQPMDLTRHSEMTYHTAANIFRVKSGLGPKLSFRSTTARAFEIDREQVSSEGTSSTIGIEPNSDFDFLVRLSVIIIDTFAPRCLSVLSDADISAWKTAVAFIQDHVTSKAALPAGVDTTTSESAPGGGPESGESRDRMLRGEAILRPSATDIEEDLFF